MDEDEIVGRFRGLCAAAAALRADASLSPRARQVALQVLFAEALRRRGRRAPRARHPSAQLVRGPPA